MLDRFFLQKLTKKGKTAYWLIQLSIDLIFILSLIFICDYDWDQLFEDKYYELIIGIIASMFISGGICLSLWKKEETGEEESAG